MKKTNMLIAGLCLALLLVQGCSSHCRDQRSLFITGRVSVTQGRYEAAIPLLRHYLAKCPQGEMASRARFFLGKAEVGLHDYAAARTEFEAVIRDYPDSLEAHKAEYKLAMIEMWSGNPAGAAERLEKLLTTPDGPLVPEAGAMLRYLRGE